METQRDLAIDRFRGLVTLLMVAGNFISGLAFVPLLLKHAPDIGFTIADTVAPCFILAIGLTYGASFEKRIGQNKFSAYQHFLTRYFALIGIGALFSAGGMAIANQSANWGVLQAIGVSGLICLAFIRTNTCVRLVAGGALLCVYQIILNRLGPDLVLQSSHGGFLGAMSWGAMMIIATAMADFRRKGTWPFVACCASLAAVSVISVFLSPISKNRVSPSYVLIALTISCIAFFLFDIGTRLFKGHAGFFCWWGENPLTLYVLHLVLLALIVLPSARWWYSGAPVWLSAIQLSAMLAMLSLAAWWLHKRRLIIKL